MTRAALVPVHAEDLLRQANLRTAFERVAEVRGAIPSATEEELRHIQGWAKALNAIAQAKAARELAVQACAAQVMAERRIGELLISGELRNPELIDATTARLAGKIARMPDDLFRRLFQRAEEGSRSFGSAWMYHQSRYESLVEVEKHIFRAWDGSYTVRARDKKNTKWRRSLPDARLLREEIFGADIADGDCVAVLRQLIREAGRLAESVATFFADEGRRSSKGHGRRINGLPLIGEADGLILAAIDKLEEAYAASVDPDTGTRDEQLERIRAILEAAVEAPA